MSNDPDVIASCLNQEEAEKWQQLYRGQKIKFYRARQKVFYCGHCNDLLCQLSVDAELENGDKMVFGDTCERCGCKLREVELQDHTICPVCKDGELVWKQTGFWD